VHHEALLTGLQEILHGFGLLTGHVVHDQVQRLGSGATSIQQSQKAHVFFVSLPVHALTDHLPAGHLQGGKQRSDPVALVVMGLTLRDALLQR